MKITIDIGSDLTPAQTKKVLKAVDLSMVDSKIFDELMEALESTGFDSDSVWVENVKIVDI